MDTNQNTSPSLFERANMRWNRMVILIDHEDRGLIGVVDTGFKSGFAVRFERNAGSVHIPPSFGVLTNDHSANQHDRFAILFIAIFRGLRCQ